MLTKECDVSISHVLREVSTCVDFLLNVELTELEASSLLQKHTQESDTTGTTMGTLLFFRS